MRARRSASFHVEKPAARSSPITRPGPSGDAVPGHELDDRVDRPGRPAAHELAVVHEQAVGARHREPEHRQTVHARDDGRRVLVHGNVRGHEDDPVVAEGRPHLLGEAQVPDVHGVEGAAEDGGRHAAPPVMPMTARASSSSPSCVDGGDAEHPVGRECLDQAGQACRSALAVQLGPHEEARPGGELCGKGGELCLEHPHGFGHALVAEIHEVQQHRAALHVPEEAQAEAAARGRPFDDARGCPRAPRRVLPCAAVRGVASAS